MRARNLLPLSFEVFNMKFYRFLDECCNFFVCFANRNAARKFWNVGTKTVCALLDDNQIFHTRTYFFRAACFRMLFKVPGGTMHKLSMQIYCVLRSSQLFDVDLEKKKLAFQDHPMSSPWLVRVPDQ
jgi:hypothetical protein